MNPKKINKLMKKALRLLQEQGPTDTVGLYKRMRGKGVRITLKELKQVMRLVERLGMAERTTPPPDFDLAPEFRRDWDEDREAAKAKMRRLLAREGYKGQALDAALDLRLDMIEALRTHGPMSRDTLIERLEGAGWQRDYLEAEVCQTSDVGQAGQDHFSIYDRDGEPLVEADDLKDEVAEMVAEGMDIPFLAFVSGPNLNLRVEFDDYKAEEHKGLAAHGLMGLIRKGADRIVTVSEIWFKEEDGTPTWDGVMIMEATAAGDTLHTVSFEGKNRIGTWETAPGGPEGNLSRLFARAQPGS